MAKNKRIIKQQRRATSFNRGSGRRVKRISQSQTGKILRLAQAGKMHAPHKRVSSSRRTRVSSQRSLSSSLRYRRIAMGVSLLLISAAVSGAVIHFSGSTGQVLGVVENMKITFSDIYTQGTSMQNSELDIVFLPLVSNDVEVVASGNNYLYPEAYDFVDVAIEDLGSGIEQTFLLKKPGHPMIFSFAMTSNNVLRAESDIDGNIFLSATDQERVATSPISPAMTIVAPTVYDADGKQWLSAASSSLEDDVVTFSLNPLWARQVQYPIELRVSIQ